MTLHTQRRIAAQVMKCGEGRVRFDQARLSDIKEAITKADVRHLIKEGAIIKKQATGISRYHARHLAQQKRKGRRQGEGSRKGAKNARSPSKRAWISRIRAQREFLKEVKSKTIITPQEFRNLYAKAKGGFFRSRRHIKLYMEEQSIGRHAEKKDSLKKSKKGVNPE